MGVQGTTALLHIAPGRSDMLSTAYLDEHIRYHGRTHGRVQSCGAALKGGVNVANNLWGSHSQEWG